MQPENGAECAVFEPADEQLAIRGIVRIADDEAADIGGPIRDPGDFKIETGGNLARKAEPVRFHVTGPSGNGVALDARESGARKNEDALLVRSSSLPLVDTSGSHQRIQIC